MKSYSLPTLVIVAVVAIIIGFFVGQAVNNDSTTAVTDNVSTSSTTGVSQVQTQGTGKVVVPSPAVSNNTKTVVASGYVAEFSPVGAKEYIQVKGPFPGTHIASPVKITGQALASWYNKNVFPVVIEDSKGTAIASGQAFALGSWLTESSISFEAYITYVQQPAGSKGYVILKNYNASGLPANDMMVKIPIIFK